MLPARPEMNKTYRNDDEIVVKPGSWWRLADENHELAEREAPEHGLVLMVSEARKVDGELHTIVLHPHPLWTHHRQHGAVKLLLEEFLCAFKPEPEAEALRETEIAAVMGRVQEISVEIATPPEPMLLLERQKEAKSAGAAAAEPKDSQDSDETTELQDDAPVHVDTKVPSVLLPSQDIVAAQTMIETRIAAFEAQRNWITGKTEELQSNMNLVAVYQQEKVNTSLAGISEETNRAQDLLKSVQTMRLFLGEDMEVTQLLDGESADPSEPLTFMQQMLFLDEEIYINDLLEGINADNMSDLPEILGRDFSLVERMLPYPRCVAITRVRRNTRELDIGEKVTIGELFERMAIIKADQRIQILVRDGSRVHMITADEATSHATRLFPSRVEIDGLFKKSQFRGEPAMITPDDIDYTDARARHDSRALFYKRFLLILWGVHERTDAFGPFAPKGINWLDATIHSERFRFIHDEEEVLEDGRPSIDRYIASHNDRIRAGSRVLFNPTRAASEETARSIVEVEDYRTSLLGYFPNTFEVSQLVKKQGALVAQVPFTRQRKYSYHSDGGRDINASILIRYSGYHTVRDPAKLFDTTLANGVICIDDLEVADMDYYIASRRARKSYGSWLHLFNRAREIAIVENRTRDDLIARMMPAAGHAELELFKRALKVWRGANKWTWPETEKEQAAVRKIYDRAYGVLAIEAIAATHDKVIEAGIKANGDIYVIHDANPRFLAGGTPLPWVTEVLYASPNSRKAKSEKMISWFDVDSIDTLVCYRNKDNDQAIQDRLAPETTRQVGFHKTEQTVRLWKISRGSADTRLPSVIEKLESSARLVSDIRRMVSGENKQLAWELLERCFEDYKTSNGGAVRLPSYRAFLGLLHGQNQHGIEQMWMLGLEIDPREFAWARGLKDEVRREVHNTYAKPSAVLQRLDDNNRPGIGIFHQLVSLRRPAAALYKPGIFLSFESSDEMINTWALPKGEEFTWREKHAMLIAAPKSEGWNSRFEAATLREAATRLHLVGPDGADELAAEIEAFRDLKQK